MDHLRKLVLFAALGSLLLLDLALGAAIPADAGGGSWSVEQRASTEGVTLSRRASNPPISNSTQTSDQDESNSSSDDESSSSDDSAKSDLSNPEMLLDLQAYERKGEQLVNWLGLSLMQLMADMRRLGMPASQSQFTNVNVLQQYGWEREEIFPFNYGPESPAAVMEVVNDLHISAWFEVQPPHNVAVTWTHSGETTIGEQYYPRTGAEYSNVYNPIDGLIVAYFDRSPQHQIEVRPHLHELNQQLQAHGQRLRPPPLEHWFEVTFLEWQNQCLKQHRNINGLRCIIRVDATSRGTKAMANRIIDDGRGGNLMQGVMDNNEPPLVAPTFAQKITLYPGQGNGQFESILGTPDAEGVAWPLLSHRAQLGHKRIKGISIFRTYRAPTWP